MKAKSIKGNSTAEIKNALSQCISDGFIPTLAIVFISIKQDRSGICKILDDEGIAVFGATTNGQFIDEETQSASIVLLLMDIKTDYFSVLFDEYPDKNYRAKANDVAKASLKLFDHPA